jgi:phage-related protein
LCGWRDADAIVIMEVFAKRTRVTPRNVIEACQERLKRYDRVAG